MMISVFLVLSTVVVVVVVVVGGRSYCNLKRSKEMKKKCCHRRQTFLDTTKVANVNRIKYVFIISLIITIDLYTIKIYMDRHNTIKDNSVKNKTAPQTKPPALPTRRTRSGN